MKNLHKYISDQYGMEALYLIRDWKILWIRDSDYRNHWIFTLRYISKGITPVSIRLKTTVRTERARIIIRKTENNLLQARVKSINSLLDNNAKQRERCWSQLASLISTTSMLECQELKDKVRESRCLKLRARQIRKFNSLFQKERNIACSSTHNPPQLGSSADPSSAPSQLRRNAGREGTQSQAGNVSPQADSVSIPKPGRSTGSAGT